MYNGTPVPVIMFWVLSLALCLGALFDVTSKLDDERSFKQYRVLVVFMLLVWIVISGLKVISYL